MQPAGRSPGDKAQQQQQQQLSQAGRAAAASKKRSSYQHEAAATASGHTPQVPVNAAAAVAAAAVAAADMHEMEAKRLREENAELADRLAQLKQAYATLKVCLAYFFFFSLGVGGGGRIEIGGWSRHKQGLQPQQSGVAHDCLLEWTMAYG